MMICVLHQLIELNKFIKVEIIEYVYVMLDSHSHSSFTHIFLKNILDLFYLRPTVLYH